MIEAASGRCFDGRVSALIVGGGSAGLTAGLALAEADVDCFIVERDRACLGSSSMSLGAVCAAGTREQDRHGVIDDADCFHEDIMVQTKGLADPVVAGIVSAWSGPVLNWLAERHDVDFALDLGWRPAFGHRAQRLHTVAEKSGKAMMSRLAAATDHAGAGILTQARVAALFAGGDGRVEGVRIERPDGSVEEIGCDMVILATSGFGANPEMIRHYIPDMRDARYFGWDGNEGDGILWGQALGAAVGDMASYQGLGLLAVPYGIDVNPKLLIEGGVQVNALGERFHNELVDVSGQGALVLAQPGGVGWVIYDERIRTACSALPQLKELQALGGERRARDVQALATAIDVPLERLGQTLSMWRSTVEGRQADPYGRPSGGRSLTAPYCAIRVTGALFHTQGGLNIDSEARVLRPDGSPLPNLYATGGAARGMSGPGPSGYLPGAGLSCAMTLGYVAGKAAVRAAHAS